MGYTGLRGIYLWPEKEKSQMNSHELVKSNWNLFQAGEITLAELEARNDAVKVEVVSVPREVRKAQQIFAPHSEKGCPVDKEECPF